MRVDMDSDGIQNLLENVVMNRSPNDYRRCPWGSKVMIVDWWLIDKIDDDKKKLAEFDILIKYICDTMRILFFYHALISPLANILHGTPFVH